MISECVKRSREGLPVEPSDLLHHIVDVLERLRVEYAAVGSIASSYYGEPRFTNDVDILANIRRDQVAVFVAAFSPDDYYVSENAVREAIQTHGQFNIIHPESGLKADIIIPDESAFDHVRLSRRLRGHVAEANFDAYFASPEDVILKKMEYYREGGSDKHLRDITGMLKIRGDQIDRVYINEWAQRVGVTDIWNFILGRLNQRQ